MQNVEKSCAYLDDLYSFMCVSLVDWISHTRSYQIREHRVVNNTWLPSEFLLFTGDVSVPLLIFRIYTFFLLLFISFIGILLALLITLTNQYFIFPNFSIFFYFYLLIYILFFITYFIYLLQVDAPLIFLFLKGESLDN